MLLARNETHAAAYDLVRCTTAICCTVIADGLNVVGDEERSFSDGAALLPAPRERVPLPRRCYDNVSTLHKLQRCE
jgi:hypothetical protein